MSDIETLEDSTPIGLAVLVAIIGAGATIHFSTLIIIVGDIHLGLGETHGMVVETLL